MTATEPRFHVRRQSALAGLAVIALYIALIAVFAESIWGPRTPSHPTAAMAVAPAPGHAKPDPALALCICPAPPLTPRAER